MSLFINLKNNLDKEIKKIEGRINCINNILSFSNDKKLKIRLKKEIKLNNQRKNEIDNIYILLNGYFITNLNQLK